MLQPPTPNQHTRVGNTDTDLTPACRGASVTDQTQMCCAVMRQLNDHCCMSKHTRSNLPAPARMLLVIRVTSSGPLMLNTQHSNEHGNTAPSNGGVSRATIYNVGPTTLGQDTTL